MRRPQCWVLQMHSLSSFSQQTGARCRLGDWSSERKTPCPRLRGRVRIWTYTAIPGEVPELRVTVVFPAPETTCGTWALSEYLLNDRRSKWIILLLPTRCPCPNDWPWSRCLNLGGGAVAHATQPLPGRKQDDPTFGLACVWHTYRNLWHDFLSRDGAEAGKNLAISVLSPRHQCRVPAVPTPWSFICLCAQPGKSLTCSCSDWQPWKHLERGNLIHQINRNLI